MFSEGLLQGKRILVTGGGSGLGREIAAKYLSLGAELHICGRRKKNCFLLCSSSSMSSLLI